MVRSLLSFCLLAISLNIPLLCKNSQAELSPIIVYNWIKINTYHCVQLNKMPIIVYY